MSNSFPFCAGNNFIALKEKVGAHLQPSEVLGKQNDSICLYFQSNNN